MNIRRKTGKQLGAADIVNIAPPANYHLLPRHGAWGRGSRMCAGATGGQIAKGRGGLQMYPCIFEFLGNDGDRIPRSASRENQTLRDRHDCAR